MIGKKSMFKVFVEWLRKTFGPDTNKIDIYSDVEKTPLKDGTGVIVHVNVPVENSKRKLRKKSEQ